MPGREPIDELLDRAIAALNEGDRDGAAALAEEVLTADEGNVDAREVRAAAAGPSAELRRLTVVFCDLVGSTELSARMEVEEYHSLLVRYQDLCREILERRFGGSIISFRGDGVLATFGFPRAHEDDVDRAVSASLEVLAALADPATDIGVQARLAVHKGVVFVDRNQGDLYGYAVNVAARLEALAEPGTVVVSDEVRALLPDQYEITAHAPRAVKGVAEPLVSHTVRSRRPVRVVPPALTPLVGRGDELAALRLAWQAASDGARARGTSVSVVGEAGIGKSRLVGDLCLEARAEGATVLELAGSPRHTGSGLWPVRRLLEDRAGLTPSADAHERLSRLRTLLTTLGLGEISVALLATLLDIDPAVGFERIESDDRRLRDEIAQAAIDFLRAASGDAATILVAEDHHWFDDATRDLVNQVIRLDEPTLLVIAASRDATTVPRGSATTVLTLAPLDDAGRIELVLALGGERLDADIARALAERSDGIPLYAEALLQGVPLDADRPVVLTDVASRRGPVIDPSVPEVLYESLVARLNVDASAMEVASVAATIGRDVDLDLLRRACPLGPAEQRDGIEALLTQRVLEPHQDRPNHLRFHHELLRAVVDDLQPASRRRELHRRVADALLAEDTDRQAVDWFVVGTHLEGADEVAGAADAFARSAAAAKRRGDLLEARAILTRAIDLVEGSPLALPVQEVELRLRRGFLTISLEGNTSAQAAADYEACLALVATGDDPAGLVSTLTCLAGYYLAKGEPAPVDALYARLVSVPGPLHEVARYMGLTGRGLTVFYRGRYEEACELVEEAITLTDAFVGDDAYERWFFIPLDPVATNSGVLNLARFLMGDVADVDEGIAATRAITAALPFPQGAFSAAGMLTFEIWIEGELGRHERVAALLDELAEMSTRYGFDQWAMVGMTAREVHECFLEIRDGADPATLLQRGHTIGNHMAMWKMIDQWVFVPYYQTAQAMAYAAAGERELARATLEDTLEIAARTGMTFYDAETLRHLASVTDEPERRVELLREALALANEQRCALFGLRAATDLYRETADDEPLRAMLGRFPASASYGLLDEARSLLR